MLSKTSSRDKNSLVSLGVKSVRILRRVGRFYYSIRKFDRPETFYKNSGKQDYWLNMLQP